MFVPTFKRTVVRCDVILGPHYRHTENAEIASDSRESDTQVRIDDFSYQAETDGLEKSGALSASPSAMELDLAMAPASARRWMLHTPYTQV